MDIINKLTSLEHEASDYGFKWENPHQIISQIRSEIAEIEVHLLDQDKVKLQEEIGDLIHAVFSLCVFCQFDGEKTLSDSINKFERRFRETQRIASKEGFNTLNGQSFDKLMELWNKAKSISG